jgi:hypothetical protein
VAKYKEINSWIYDQVCSVPAGESRALETIKVVTATIDTQIEVRK